jgi:hypothetical protein
MIFERKVSGFLDPKTYSVILDFSATLKQVPLITDNTSKLKFLSFLLKPKNRNLSLAAFC